MFLWVVPVEGNPVTQAVPFEGSFREGTIVNKENALAVSKLLVAFIFQKTVTVEYPGGLDRTKKLYNK